MWMGLLYSVVLIDDFVHFQNMNMKKGNETRHLLHLVGIKDDFSKIKVDK